MSPTPRRRRRWSGRRNPREGSASWVFLLRRDRDGARESICFPCVESKMKEVGSWGGGRGIDYCHQHNLPRRSADLFLFWGSRILSLVFGRESWPSYMPSNKLLVCIISAWG